MTDRPILFSAAMVRALLAGTKTQTRRQIKPRGKRPSLFNGDWSDSYVLAPGNESWRKQDVPIEVGDRLWVKETWTHAQRHGYDARGDGGEYWYRSTDNGEVDGPWKPSIFMPRHASRITLIVTGVRVERLQDISEADAIAEGVERAPKNDGWWKSQTSGKLCPTARDAYGDLWNYINGPGAWEANPWVAAYTFTVHRGNIDQIGGAA